MATAQLAYQHVRTAHPKALRRLIALLKGHPHYQQFLANHRPDGVDEAEWVFLRAATWPDWVRPAKKNQAPRPRDLTRYHRGDDHFIDQPYIRPGDEGRFAGRDLSPDPEKNNALCALRQRIGELRSEYTAEADKAVALCWVLHLVGDLHQPLHCATLYSRDFVRDGDHGGNAFGLKVGGHPTNLHSYWDDLLGAVPGSYEDTPKRARAVYRRAQEAAEQLHDPRYGRAQLARDLARGKTAASWAQESFKLARSAAYSDQGRFIEGKRVIKDMVPDTAPKVSSGYAATALAVAQKRVALAGYRLADKLPAWLPKPQP